jgi:hypothetical protein
MTDDAYIRTLVPPEIEANAKRRPPSRRRKERSMDTNPTNPILDWLKAAPIGAPLLPEYQVRRSGHLQQPATSDGRECKCVADTNKGKL